MVVWRSGPANPHCMVCGRGFIPGLKNKNVCGDCWRIVGAHRHKYGLPRIPAQDRQVLMEREKNRKRILTKKVEDMDFDWNKRPSTEEKKTARKFAKKIVTTDLPAVKRKGKWEWDKG